MTNNNNDDDATILISALEQHAAAVVTKIRGVADVIRPKPLTPKERRRPGEGTATINYEATLLSPQFGIATLIQEWQQLEAQVGTTTAVNPTSSFILCNDWQPPPTETPRSSLRQRLVYQVLWPLLEQLGLVYTHLDAIPTPPPPPPVLSNNPQRHTKSKPPPPPGLLSLQDYTAVAALLEWTTAVSAVPCCEPAVLPWPRPLPKAVSVASHALTGWTISPADDKYYELQGTAARMAAVLQLDRFRPMFLPRHVVDLHAVFWQCQQLVVHDQDTARAQHGQWYPSTWSSLWPTATKDTRLLDDTLLVATCQKLLQQGPRAPAWLQTAVSTTLQAVAERNLGAVWAVFGAAPLRLARTLVTGPLQRYQQAKNHDATAAVVFAPLVTQLCWLMDQVLQAHCPMSNSNVPVAPLTTVTTWTEADTKKMEFVWALLEQLPPAVVETDFWRAMANSGVHACVRRWTIFFHWIPPFVNLAQWSRRLWQIPLGMSDDDSALTSSPVVRLLWELATAPLAVQSTIQADALYAIQLWSQAMLAGRWKDTTALDVFALWILHTLQPSTQRYEFTITSQDHGLDHVAVQSVSTPPTAMLMDPAQLYVQAQAGTMERRARIAIEKLILPLSQESVAKANTGLPSRLLQILVVLYLSFGSDTLGKELILVPKTLLTPNFQLVCMTLLPLLCELCSLEALLADPASSIPLLNLMSLVFRTVSLQMNGVDAASSSPSNETNPSSSLTVASNVVSKLCPHQHDDSLEGNLSSLVTDEESKFSIASILLTLLVGVLELGAERRSSDEEVAFKSLVPLLTVLSSIPFDTNINHSVMKEFSEMSEMASHANALIAARSANSLECTIVDEALDPITRQYLIAKEDVKSNEVPMRARGVVTLRHLTFALVDTPNQSPTNASTITLSDIVCLAIKCLTDSESYVYLAAIQTIAAAALQETSDMTRRLCSAFASGYFPSSESGEICLSSEQRIKLAEALVAFVRRKASLVQHLDDIFSTLFNSVTPKASTTTEEADMIQVQTHRYFLGNKEIEDTAEKEDQWEEMKLRVNTGGPLFDIEENDLLRGAAINLVSEVVRACSPANLARFVPTLIQCAKMCLQLDCSRPVRRSGALLASSLYGAVLREIEEQNPEILSKRQLDCPLTLAMVRHDEASLVTSLSRTEKGTDLLDLQEERLFDQATVARCQEALACRESIKATGTLELAAIVVASRSGVPSILRVQETSVSSQKPKITIVTNALP